MESKDLKRIKLIFKNNKNENLSIDYFNTLINSSKDFQKKNFFRGCKHILERHYTEAIKWFQLSDDFEESILLILFCSLKVGDRFLFNEYYTEDLSNFTLFKSYAFYPFILKENEEIPLNLKSIKALKEKYL